MSFDKLVRNEDMIRDKPNEGSSSTHCLVWACDGVSGLQMNLSCASGARCFTKVIACWEKRCNILYPQVLNAAFLRLLMLTPYGHSCPMRRNEWKLMVMSVNEPCTPPAVLYFSARCWTKKGVHPTTSETSLGRLWLGKCVSSQDSENRSISLLLFLKSKGWLCSGHFLCFCY